MNDVFAHIDQHAPAYVERLRALCRQPSISTQNTGMAETAAMVQQMLAPLGFSPRLIDVPGGFPVVYGERAGAGGRTLSFYNHYDVQPAEPLELWQSEPFAADVRDGYIYARGVADDKGDLVARICALDSYLAVRGNLPIHVKFLIEGEEEIGSPHLAAFAESHQDLLAADGCIWEGGSRDAQGRPEITLGVKGICYVELSVRSANMDLHSMWAPIVPNAAWRLTWALSTLKDGNERILIDDYYDDVQQPTADEIALLTPLDAAALQQQWALRGFLGDGTAKDLAARLYFQPTCTICGIQSGYTGPGLKTVLPNEARVKIDFRLVPNQTPQHVVELLRAHLDRRGFHDIEVKLLGGLLPAKTGTTGHFAHVLMDAAREIYQAQPVVQPMMAGSGPMYQMCQKFGIPAGSGGVANSNSRYHAPNENISIADYILGIKYVAAIIDRF